MQYSFFTCSFPFKKNLDYQFKPAEASSHWVVLLRIIRFTDRHHRVADFCRATDYESRKSWIRVKYLQPDNSHTLSKVVTCPLKRFLKAFFCDLSGYCPCSVSPPLAASSTPCGVGEGTHGKEIEWGLSQELLIDSETHENWMVDF